jgi:hypothetical protein
VANAIIERDSRGGPSIVVLNEIGLSFKLGPVIIQIGAGRGSGVVMAARYIDQVLRPRALHVINTITFQHDNSHAHSAIVTTDFPQQKNIEVML